MMPMRSARASSASSRVRKSCASKRYCTLAAVLIFRDRLDLLLGGLQRVAEMRVGVGLVAFLLLDARDILRIEALQGRQPEAVQQNAGQHEAAGPEDIFEHEAFLPDPLVFKIEPLLAGWQSSTRSFADRPHGKKCRDRASDNPRSAFRQGATRCGGRLRRHRPPDKAGRAARRPNRSASRLRS